MWREKYYYIICIHLKIATKSFVYSFIHNWMAEKTVTLNHRIHISVYRLCDSVLYNVYYIRAVLYDYMSFTQFRDKN